MADRLSSDGRLSTKPEYCSGPASCQPDFGPGTMGCLAHRKCPLSMMILRLRWPNLVRKVVDMASMSGSEDVWIPSVCGMCPDQCGILVHRVDGVVTKIEGNPKSPVGRGRLCARGLAGIQLLYDPHRLNQPLRRGNPEKGIGVDPRWQPIGWDEALEAIVERLKHVRDENPAGSSSAERRTRRDRWPSRCACSCRPSAAPTPSSATSACWSASGTPTLTSANTCSCSGPTAQAAQWPRRWPTPACAGCEWWRWSPSSALLPRRPTSGFPSGPAARARWPAPC